MYEFKKMRFHGQTGCYPLESTGESSRNKNIPRRHVQLKFSQL